MKTLLLATLLMSGSVFAGDKIDITVKGMVCSFCSQGITKKFKEEGVKNVNVDLGKHLVSIELADNQKLDNARIEKLLTDAGYGVEKIETK
ncbi:copper chaperone [Bacteriovorax stolpii]|uniref:Heavy metal transporter n=1 Tax=Bacteriovorax stolpii TaxID=960 RepID=A0A2K9NP29_BACTC|nr:heavy-metal-associated domain-containing protein [Bacteriovorax stolpii]AUN97280.1 heavy metal transporter [Bacteriovorax stolpii]QDK42782.1 copper chaperone [Bacteriovorax stolpii]TDP52450.1 copper chaperone CopZ [Bacteriovorax stolpii]